MNDDNKVKVVVKTLNTGVAKPIEVTSDEALRIAKAQNENMPKADITLDEKKTIDEVIKDVKEEDNKVVSNVINVNDINYNQEVNIEKLNEVNDLVKIKTVKKENPKVVIVLVIILVIIIMGFFIFELPWLIKTLGK